MAGRTGRLARTSSLRKAFLHARPNDELRRRPIVSSVCCLAFTIPWRWECLDTRGTRREWRDLSRAGEEHCMEKGKSIAYSGWRVLVFALQPSAENHKWHEHCKCL